MLAATLLAACFGGTDDGAGEEAGSNATRSIPATFALRPIDATVPDETLAGEDGSSIAEVVADDTVTADELAAAYEAYVGVPCRRRRRGSLRLRHRAAHRVGGRVGARTTDRLTSTATYSAPAVHAAISAT